MVFVINAWQSTARRSKHSWRTGHEGHPPIPRPLGQIIRGGLPVKPKTPQYAYRMQCGLSVSSCGGHMVTSGGWKLSSRMLVMASVAKCVRAICVNFNTVEGSLEGMGNMSAELMFKRM